MPYLFEYKDNDRSTGRIARVIAEKYQVSLSDFNKEGSINSIIKLNTESGYSSYLSEFPGNCSILVLGYIETYITSSDDLVQSHVKSVLEFSIELCKEFKYAALIVSGSIQSSHKFLEDKGFVEYDRIYNPHSGHETWFMRLVTTEE